MDESKRRHTIEEIRVHWLRNRRADGSDWEQALGAVYDLALAGERERQIELLANLAEDARTHWLSHDSRTSTFGECLHAELRRKLAELRKEAGNAD